jgi:hypothetical protein
MKNNECTIYIEGKLGWLQKYRKDDKGWAQTSRNGTVRRLSAEQLLSHILPVIARKGNFAVRVEADAPDHQSAPARSKKGKEKETGNLEARRRRRSSACHGYEVP